MKKKSKEKSAGKSRKFPAEINRMSLPNGDPVYDVQTVTSINFASTYSKDHIYETLARWIIDLYEAAMGGEPLKNFPFEKFKVKLHPKQAEKNGEEVLMTLHYYSVKSSMLLEHALPLKLADLPEQLLMEVFISIVQEMENNEVFSIEGGRADVWDNYTSELGRALKRYWNKTIPRGVKYWTPEKRASLLTIYNYAFVPMQEWWKKYYSSAKARRLKPTAKDRKEAEKKYPDLYTYFHRLSNTPPNQLALEYVSAATKIGSYEALRAQITKARKEATQEKK